MNPEELCSESSNISFPNEQSKSSTSNDEAPPIPPRPQKSNYKPRPNSSPAQLLAPPIPQAPTCSDIDPAVSNVHPDVPPLPVSVSSAENKANIQNLGVPHDNEANIQEEAEISFTKKKRNHTRSLMKSKPKIRATISDPLPENRERTGSQVYLHVSTQLDQLNQEQGKDSQEISQGFTIIDCVYVQLNI